MRDRAGQETATDRDRGAGRQVRATEREREQQREGQEGKRAKERHARKAGVKNECTQKGQEGGREKTVSSSQLHWSISPSRSVFPSWKLSATLCVCVCARVCLSVFGGLLGLDSPASAVSSDGVVDYTGGQMILFLSLSPSLSLSLAHPHKCSITSPCCCFSLMLFSSKEPQTHSLSLTSPHPHHVETLEACVSARQRVTFARGHHMATGQTARVCAVCVCVCVCLSVCLTGTTLARPGSPDGRHVSLAKCQTLKPWPESNINCIQFTGEKQHLDRFTHKAVRHGREGGRGSELGRGCSEMEDDAAVDMSGGGGR